MVKNHIQIKITNLRTYYHQNILAFGDQLHRVHPLAGQGFNMTIRDVSVLLRLIKFKNLRFGFRSFYLFSF